MGLRYKKANVTHPELGVTVQLPILVRICPSHSLFVVWTIILKPETSKGVKKNPQSPMYTALGVLTRGTIVEVNVAELGLVTASGKVVWGRWARESSLSIQANVRVFRGLTWGVWKQRSRIILRMMGV